MISWKRGAIAAIVLAGAAIAGSVEILKLHSRGYCITQQRVLPEKQMFAAAVKAAYGPHPLGVEALRDVRVGNDPIDGPSIEVSYKSQSSRTLSARVDRLMDDPSYRRACCKWGWVNTQRRPPDGSEIFWGSMPKGVVVRVEVVTTLPQSIQPALYKMPGNKDSWFSDATKVEIDGPILYREQRDVTIPMTVCGQVGGLQF